jgi:hypothetical protein
MDFFEQQERARRQTTLLLAYFAAAVAVIVALGYVIFASLALPFLKPLPCGSVWGPSSWRLHGRRRAPEP